MKYVFLLLVLAGCGQKAEKQKAEAIKAKAMASADAVLEEMNAKNTIFYTPPPSPPVEEKVIASDPNDYERPGNHEEREAVSISEYEISLYLTNINPYRKEYEAFFKKQLNLYGRDYNGELLIYDFELGEMNTHFGFTLLPDINNPSRIDRIRIIEHGKTNYYPLASNH